MNHLQSLIAMFQNHQWFAFLFIIGLIGFVVYRIADWLQIGFVKTFPQPEDLKKLPEAVYESKRRRKMSRAYKSFWKGIANWLIQVLITVLAIPMVVVFLFKQGITYGWIYIILIAFGYILNLLFSKYFSLWTPASLRTDTSKTSQNVLSKGNLIFHAWGIISWSGPAYLFWSYYETNGWVGSIFSMILSQTIQLLIFIYTIKKSAIPYQEYDGLSKEFKKSLQKYLQDQGLRDDEVGVLENSKMGPNAFATGLFGYKQIILTDELIKGYKDKGTDFVLKLGDNTIEAIVAHEMGHLKNHHIEKSIAIGTFISGLVTVGVYHLFSSNPTSYFFFEQSTTHQILLYWGQAIFNLMLLYPLTFFMMTRAQSNEYEADSYMLETNGCKNGQDFFHQMRHIAPVSNHPFWHSCNMTHPDPYVREVRMIEWTKEHCK
ncbi:MAG: M48 family metalloprotease [Candidatus Brocadiae bacterium]|nr:M48 family metalloprotease [Candidatus Brocadiia bacterium]